MTVKRGGILQISKSNRAHLRAVRAYLIFILILTFVLFSSSLISMVRQEDQALISSIPTFDVKQELIFRGLSAAMFLSIMGLGIFLLIRIMRALNWMELRNDFVNSVSHELKTPLSLIRLYSETLAEGGFGEEERLNYIRIIARESRRLTSMIDNILDYANIEHGQKKHEAKAGDLSAAVASTVENYSGYIASEGFRVETDIPESLPRVLFDRSEIVQLIVNLLDNAKKYSGESKLIRVRMWAKDHEVALAVEDFGIGIPAEEQTRIFEPFYQASAGGSKRGSGLGLYLVRHIMDGLGGRIDLTSEVGRGSRFTLFFPVVKCAIAAPAASSEKPKALEMGAGN